METARAPFDSAIEPVQSLTYGWEASVCNVQRGQILAPHEVGYARDTKHVQSKTPRGRDVFYCLLKADPGRVVRLPVSASAGPQ